MSEKSNVFKQALKHKGYFSFRDLYIFCYDWLKDQGYKVAEEEYTEKLSSHGKEVVIRWKAKKKISDYFRNIIEVKWHILGMTDVEVEREGKKEKANKGDLKLSFSADLERDYEKRWEDNPFWKFLRGIYDRYVIRTTIDEYEERLRSKAENYVEQIKSFLVLEGKK